MPKRNLKLNTASLRSFLQTGDLGPVSAGLSLLEDCEAYPFYWGYADLELNFAAEAPHFLEHFKLRDLPLAGKKFTKFCSLLRMSNDGLHTGMRLSEMLQQGIWDLDQVEIGICEDQRHPALDIVFGNIELLYRMADTDEESLKRKGIAAAQGEGGEAQLIAFRDQNSFLLGIYSVGDSPKRGRYFPDRWKSVSGREYLQLIGEVTSSEPGPL